MKADENWSKEATVIYCNCCFEMGRRFRKLGQKFADEGNQEKAAELKAEATIQIEAWRKARRELRKAG